MKTIQEDPGLRSQSYFVVSCAVLTYQVFIDYMQAYVRMLPRSIGHVGVLFDQMWFFEKCLNAVLIKLYGTPGSTGKGNVVDGILNVTHLKKLCTYDSGCECV